MKPFAVIFNSIRIILPLILISFSSAVVWSQYDFGFSVDTEIANSLNEGNVPPETQSFITIEQNWQSKDKKLKGLLQARNLSYSYEFENGHYSNSELYPVDTYIEYLPPSQRITLGYQHIFLTEGFDSVGMELINPRNNNTSFFLAADKKFYTLPALNYRYISDFITIQLIHIFQSRNDQANSYYLDQVRTLNAGLQIQNMSASDRMKKNDQVIRFLKTIGSFDLGISFLKTYDKTNQYQFNMQTFKLDQLSEPFDSYSFNMSGDLSGTVVRLDYLASSNRKTIVNTGELLPLNYQSYNLGLEHDFIYSSQLALNYSKSEIKTDMTTVFRKKNIEDVYLRLDKTVNEDLKIETMLLYRLSDKGQAVNLKFSYALSPLINVKAGLETFGGDKASEFILAKDFSRVYIGLFSTVF